MQPQVSFVATSRNDDHGGDVLRRTQSFVNGIAKQADRHQVPVELVLVDWNPPKQRAPLMDVIEWPKGTDYFTARAITVPRELHATLKNSAQLGMFQMIAKNVGIRRARGAFITATNIDIIFSDELFRWLKSDAARSRAVYRSDRWDIPNEIQLEPDFETLLERARRESIRKNLRDGTYVLKGGEFIKATQDRIDLMVLNWIENRSAEAEAALEAGDAETAESILVDLRNRLIPELRRNYSIPLLHTNGCGDFTMLSREDWFDIRGYPEWHVFSWAIDSIFIYQAHFNGLETINLPKDHTHYHIEHDYGSGWTISGENALWNRMDDRCVPYFSYEETMEILRELQEKANKHESTIYNEPNWGFADHSLPDELVAEKTLPARGALAKNTGKIHEPFEPVAGLEAIAVNLDTYFPLHAHSRIDEVETPEGTTLRIRTVDTPWIHGAGFDLRPEFSNGGEWWVKLRVRARKGRVTICALNTDLSAILTKSGEINASQGERDVYLCVRDALNTSCLVVRNSEAPESAYLEILSITIYPERLPSGATPKPEDIENILRNTEAFRTSILTPPLSPLAKPARCEWKHLDLANYELRNEITTVGAVKPDSALLSVVTPAGVHANAIGFDLASYSASEKERKKVRVRVSCMSGSVTMALTDSEWKSTCAESNPITPLEKSIVTVLRAQELQWLVIRNNEQYPSRVIVEAIDLEGQEILDCELRVVRGARYIANPNARLREGRGEGPVEVTTAPELHSYAIGYDLRVIFEGGGPRQVSINLRVKEGAVQLGILQKDATDWLALSDIVRPSDERKTVTVQITDSGQASMVVLRNAVEGPSVIEVVSATAAGPTRYLERVARYSEFTPLSVKARALNAIYRVWDSRHLVPIRRAAPTPLRAMWRKIRSVVRQA